MLRQYKVWSILALALCLPSVHSYGQDIDLVNPADIAQAIDLTSTIEVSIDELIDMKANLDDPIENDGPAVRILESMKQRNEGLKESLNETAFAIIDDDIELLFELNGTQCQTITNLQEANDAVKTAAEMPHIRGITPEAAQFQTIKDSLGSIGSLLGC